LALEVFLYLSYPIIIAMSVTKGPVQPAAPLVHTEELMAAGQKTGGDNSPVIVVVEDDVTVLTMYKGIIPRLFPKHQVQLCTNKQDALAVIDKDINRIKAAIIDGWFPDSPKSDGLNHQSGHDVVAAIRKLERERGMLKEGEIKGIGIMMIVGDNSIAGINLATTPLDELKVKPIEIAELRSGIEEMLRRTNNRQPPQRLTH